MLKPVKLENHTLLTVQRAITGDSVTILQSSLQAGQKPLKSTNNCFISKMIYLTGVQYYLQKASMAAGLHSAR